MKILITTDWYHPVINGVVTSVLNLETQLCRLGHEVRILTLAENMHSRKEGDAYYVRSCSAGKIYPNARVAISVKSPYVEEMIRWKPDVIHSQCEFTSFPFAKRIARETKAPILHTYHTVYEDYTHYFSPNPVVGKQLAEWFTRRIAGRVDAMIAPTEKVRELLSGYGIQKPIYTIGSGIEIERFSKRAPEPELENLRRTYGITEGQTVLVTVGRLAKEKNIEEILYGLAARQQRGFLYLLVGDGPHRPSLEALVRELGLSGQVRFTGMIEPEQVPAHYQLGDLYVSASSSETQGLTYLEALASGLPALCRRDDCLRGIIYEEGNGMLYHNQEELARKLEVLLGDPALRRQLGGAAIRSVQPWSVEQFGAQIEAVYRVLAGNTQGLVKAG